MWTRRTLLASLLLSPMPVAAEDGRTLPADPWARALIDAALAQVGVTTLYDPAYLGLSYPGGDPPRERGVCTDVIVRAYRDGLGVDLQKLVHEDMRANFSAYPRRWGLTRPDRNIDHRRVPNLQAFLTRRGAALPIPPNPADYVPGDLVTQMLPGNLPHILIVTDSLEPTGRRPLVAHNIGRGTRHEDMLFAFGITGRYRFDGGKAAAAVAPAAARGG